MVITDLGLAEIAKRNVLTTGRTSNLFIGIGTSGQLETAADTDLIAPIGNRQQANGSAYGSSERYSSNFESSFTDLLNQDIQEAGLFTAQTGGILIARITTDSPYRITNGKTLTITINVENQTL